MRQGFNQVMNVSNVMSIEKRTGKQKLIPKEYNNNDGTTFFALNVNHATALWSLSVII